MSTRALHHAFQHLASTRMSLPARLVLLALARMVAVVTSIWQQVGNVARSLVDRAGMCHEKEAGPKAIPTPTTPDHNADVRIINDG